MADLAAMIATSPPHLHRLTLKHHGQPPMTMVTGLRMRRAEAMLRGTGYTLAHIAAALGYETPFAFSRAFKRHSGRSPKEFREA